MATVADVARLAQVSAGVVSRLLNEDPTLRIRDDTRERVLRAADELNYTPNHAARALRSARVGVIGLAVHDVSNPVYSAIIEGAQAAALEAGYALMLADVDALVADDRVFKRLIVSGAIDGLLAQRAGTTSDALLTKLASRSMPTVLLNDRTSGGISSIAVDDHAAAKLATEHLVALGHRRIGRLQVDGPRSRVDNRDSGWRSALEAAGIEADDRLIFSGGHTAQTGYRGMKQLLGAKDRPTAVFVDNVLAAIGALRAAQEEGVDVPSELSVVAMHDVALADFLVPRLTVVRVGLFEMGARAVRMLLEQLADGKARHEVLSDPAPGLIQRDSVARADPVGRREA